jgi:hypothetical protein
MHFNGSGNSPIRRPDDECWCVRLIEEDFHWLIWDTEV